MAACKKLKKLLDSYGKIINKGYSLISKEI